MELIQQGRKAMRCLGEAAIGLSVMIKMIYLSSRTCHFCFSMNTTLCFHVPRPFIYLISPNKFAFLYLLMNNSPCPHITMLFRILLSKIPGHRVNIFVPLPHPLIINEWSLTMIKNYRVVISVHIYKVNAYHILLLIRSIFH